MLGLSPPPAAAFLCTEPPASKPGHAAQEPGAEEDLGGLDYATGDRRAPSTACPPLLGHWVRLMGPKPKPSTCFQVYAVTSCTATGRAANPPPLERTLGMRKRKARFSASLRTASKPCCYLGSRYGSTAGRAVECSDVPTLVTAPDCIAWSKDSHC